MATLPSFVTVLFDGYAEQRESGVIRTEFESGPPRQQRFKTRVMNKRTLKLFVNSNADFQAFEAFVYDTLEQGALFFTFTDPVKGTAVEGRLIGGVYSAKPLSSSMGKWEISCEIESWGN